MPLQPQLMSSAFKDYELIERGYDRLIITSVIKDDRHYFVMAAAWTVSAGVMFCSKEGELIINFFI